jgi:glycine oxidase ThiO
MQSSCEVAIVGGGIIGLSIALELSLLGVKVSVFCRDFQSAAAHAAAGMLAPQAEGIETGAMLDLCLTSRSLYPDWASKIEGISGVSVDYWPCGILSPRYDRPTAIDRDWIDRDKLPLTSILGEDVVGGYWYPADGQVDNRQLIQSLWQAGQILGVDYRDGVNVTQIHRDRTKVTHLTSDRGDINAQHYILATGAWSQELLPIPVVPIKGQMLSVLVPGHIRDDLPLQRVLFGEDIYLVPRKQGRVIVGATVEDVGFTPSNTVAGIDRLLTNATRLFPQIANYPIDRIWWGFRPGTPDELPILGRSAYDNLTLATGHYRNGILLAPIAGKLISDLVYHRQDAPLLPHFSWQRFLDK